MNYFKFCNIFIKSLILINIFHKNNFKVTNFKILIKLTINSNMTIILIIIFYIYIYIKK